ncbi:MAG: SGNH/GDSL hydrolase family protein [Ruminococcaceae bacterium]|nr:SGNH/GDSL hydrolase family protein [Oscillospiraceae bacterium]
MILTNEQLKSIYFGAYSFAETDDGYLQSFQYTQEQRDYFEKAFDFWYERCTASSAKTLEFTTTAASLSFDYKIIWKGSEDSFELSVDGLITQIYYVKDIADEGRLAFSLPEGEKQVVVYLPADATVLIRNFEIDAEAVPAKKGEKVLWLGDSITQGFGPLRSSHTYVSAANRILNFDIINQGIGGYIYDAKVLVPMEGYKPDRIIVSLGTNQYGDETMEAVERYYERLQQVYGDTPVICITPIWRGDNMEGVPVLERYRAGIAEVCAKYPNITVIDGFKLVPHLPEYFLDNLHPNALGAEIYGRNLAEIIRSL